MFFFSTEPCPSGFEGDGIACNPCAINTYESNSECLPCAAGEATNFERSTNCTKACNLGEFLTDEGQCMKCDYGRYQSLSRHSQKECLYCPKGFTTVIKGASQEDDCLIRKGRLLTCFLLLKSECVVSALQAPLILECYITF